MADEIQSKNTDGLTANPLDHGIAVAKLPTETSSYPNSGSVVGLPDGQVLTFRPKQTRIARKTLSPQVIVTGVRAREQSTATDPVRALSPGSVVLSHVKVLGAGVTKNPKRYSFSNPRNKARAQTSDIDMSKEESRTVLAALGEAEAALAGAIAQAKRNTTLLRDARLEIETAHAIAASSNRSSRSLTEDADSDSAE